MEERPEADAGLGPHARDARSPNRSRRGERTLSLVAVLDWETLRRQHVSILSPMIWDLGHIGNFEDLWLSQELAGLEAVEKGYERMFDATLNPRAERAALPLPRGEALFGYLAAVRDRALALLAGPRRGLRSDLTAEGLVYELVAEHEEQHQETLLQAMQLLEAPCYTPAQRRRLPRGNGARPDMVRIPAGEFLMGAAPTGFSYDNEKPRHSIAVEEFEIDRFPVSQGEYLIFVESGGYRRRELWSADGWAWCREAGVSAPLNWFRSEEGWRSRFMDQELPLPSADPVVHICYWEAEAYARSVGKRLPTEAEWEKAALWDPLAEAARTYPWGEEPPSARRANLDQLAFRPASRGAYPDGRSAYGVEQMLGDVWEWTSSDFSAYPGFEAFPYPEYSKIFFGPDYKVLRGGSWATRPAVARGTFRNWDYPIRRQIFAGLRCAR